MKYASIYQTRNKLIFCSNAQTIDGVNFSIAPYIHIDKKATDEEIVEAISQVLKGNKLDVPHPKPNEWGEISKRHLEALGIKSLTELHKNASYCSITKDKNIITFYPTRNSGHIEGYTFLPDLNKSVADDASAEEIVALLKEVLQISEAG